jgi:SH3-like domain-containing protein
LGTYKEPRGNYCPVGALLTLRLHRHGLSYAMLNSRPKIQNIVLSILAVLLLAGWLAPSSHAAGKLPRFATLRADKVNLRAGPGVRYPISWIFVRKSLPVEILAEFELWRKIRAQDGTEGWVHKSLLSGRRSAVITGKVRTLYRRANDDLPVLRAEAGVQAGLLSCKAKWCKLRVGGTEGWLKRNQIWGTYHDENFD